MLIKRVIAGAESPAIELRFSERWHLLGPFRIGTREAVWGSNPLEAFGGFHNLPVDDDTSYHSSLGVNGTVKWSTLDGVSSDHSDEGGRSVELNVTFPAVDWAFQQSVYGWAALQYQAFVRGFINVVGGSTCRVAFYTDSVLEFALNDKPSFGGDVYGFRRAPLISNLAPGENKVDLRLIRDVRSMGGIGSPSMCARLSVQRCQAVLNVVAQSAVLPDVVDGKLTSPYASIVVRNETENWITILGIQSRSDSPIVKLLNSSPLSLAPGQSRPISLSFSSRRFEVLEGIDIAFVYGAANHQLKQLTSFFKLDFCQRSIQNPHKFTFLHPSGTVSYAVLRPPIKITNHSTFPVLLNLHGAGLESDSHQVRHMLDAVPDLDAWVLFPTGMSPWSGDDWHVWGFADIISAVAAIPNWIRSMNWIGPGVDTERWVVTGHSNGGQGAWFISTYQPDKVVATAAVSGYSSIQNYVPYMMWRGASPLATSIIQNSLSNYRHELLVENLTGLPIFQQHGSEDDNVPPYHSRLLSSLLHESGCLSEFVELPGKGHWFEGAMTTEPIRSFYSSVLDLERYKKSIPETFEFIIPNSDDVGSRAGISVEQLQSPDCFGRLSVHRNDKERVWYLKTSNIHRIHLHFPVSGVQQPKAIVVDKTRLKIPEDCDEINEVRLLMSNNKWEVGGQNWKVLSARYGRQRGSIDAILRTLSPFKIQMCSGGVFDAALQVSRNLVQYYGADAEISTPEKHSGTAHGGNIISLVIGKAISPALINDFPIQMTATNVEIRRPYSNVLKRIPCQHGLGVAFLRPLPGESVELILWGCDMVGLQQAIRIVPTLTGVGQPDFVVLGNEVRWKGLGGVLAMGFFDHGWQISPASYVP